MKNILILGAGRSATVLIDYLYTQVTAHGWELTIADVSLALAREKTADKTLAKAIALDIQQEAQRHAAIAAADVVVSLLPAHLHILAAHTCLAAGKHLLTASYISPEMRALTREVAAKNLLFLNETGLDPGIDHLSAMGIIDRLHDEGASIHAFRSYCGGLVAQGLQANPWGYQFSWNPRNVVLAGQGPAATFMRQGQLKRVPYQRLFTQTESLYFEGYGELEGYPNRDSLQYRQAYGLQDVQTMLRGTLRFKGYAAAWHTFVLLGLTDDTYTLDCSSLSYADFFRMFIDAAASTPGTTIAAGILQTLDLLNNNANTAVLLQWLDIENAGPIGLTQATPAQVLQKLLEHKWALGPHDKDLVLMQHIFDYSLKGRKHRLIASLALQGTDNLHTAMAKTVGLPLGIATKLLMQGQLSERGVLLPLSRSLYEPVLQELATEGIVFKEKVFAID